MDKRTRDFFVSVLLQSKGLSECKLSSAALISRGKNIVTNQYSYGLTSSRDNYLSSPIISAVLEYNVSSRNSSDDEEALFSTYFPNFSELQVLHNTQIRTIYFFGDISDTKSAKFLNQLGKDARKDGMSDDYRIINLKTEV